MQYVFGSAAFVTLQIKTPSSTSRPWAARYNIWLLIKLMPEGVVFSFLFLLFSQGIQAGQPGGGCCDRTLYLGFRET